MLNDLQRSVRLRLLFPPAEHIDAALLIDPSPLAFRSARASHIKSRNCCDIAYFPRLRANHSSRLALPHSKRTYLPSRTCGIGSSVRSGLVYSLTQEHGTCQRRASSLASIISATV